MLLQSVYKWAHDKCIVPQKYHGGYLPFKIFCASWALNHIFMHLIESFFHYTMSPSGLSKLLRGLTKFGHILRK